MRSWEQISRWMGRRRGGGEMKERAEERKNERIKMERGRKEQKERGSE